MDDGIVCGEWFETPEGRVRKCTGNSVNPSPVERITPPAVTKPPGIERQMRGGIASERVNATARRLVESALDE